MLSAWFLGAACSYSMASDEAGMNYGDTARGADEGSADWGDADSGVALETLWISISGTLSVEKNSLRDGVLEISLVSSEDRASPSCVQSQSFSALTQIPPHPDILGWWTLELGELEGCLEGQGLPSSLSLGLGASWPEVESPADSLSGDIFGAYVAIDTEPGCSMESGDACIFGSAIMEGAESELEPYALPSASYHLSPVYLLRL